jgi:hypothetical protein
MTDIITISSNSTATVHVVWERVIVGMQVYWVQRIIQG